MFIQNQIKRTLSTPENTAYIKHLLENEEILHRTDLATRACKRFEFYDARGQIQLSGCVKALRQLEKAGHIILPSVERKEQARPGSHHDVYLGAFLCRLTSPRRRGMSRI